MKNKFKKSMVIIVSAMTLCMANPVMTYAGESTEASTEERMIITTEAGQQIEIVDVPNPLWALLGGVIVGGIGTAVLAIKSNRKNK